MVGNGRPIIFPGLLIRPLVVGHKEDASACQDSHEDLWAFPHGCSFDPVQFCCLFLPRLIPLFFTLRPLGFRSGSSYSRSLFRLPEGSLNEVLV